MYKRQEYTRAPLVGGRLAEEFSYASDTNDEWLDGPGLQAMLDEGKPTRRRRADDSRSTVEFEDRFAIEPNFAEFGRTPYAAADGAKPVAEDFSYSSDNNHDWLSPEGLLAMLEEKTAR